MSVFTEEVLVSNTVPVEGGNSTPVVVSGTVNIGTIPEVEVKNDSGNPLSVTQGGVGTATITRVGVSTTVSTLKAANVDRKRLIVHNEVGTLFVKLGSGASDTDYSYRLTANTVAEIDFYTGIVTGTKATGATFAQVTEIA